MSVFMVRSVHGLREVIPDNSVEEKAKKKPSSAFKRFTFKPGSPKTDGVERLPKGKIKADKTPPPCADKTAALVQVGKAKNEHPKTLDWKQKFINYTAKKFLNFSKGDYDFDPINKESKEKLSQLTGNPKIAIALSGLAPKISDILLKKIGEKLKKDFYKEGVEKALGDQQELITDCLNATLLKMMSNLAHATKESSEAEKITFLDMLSFLSGKTGKRLQDLHKQIADIKKIENPKVQKRRLKTLLKSFKKEVLTELLPNKEKDIVLPKGKLMGEVRKHIYKAMLDILPELIIENEDKIGLLGDGLSLFAKLPLKIDMEGLENLERLDSTIETVAENAIPIAQSFLAKNKEEYAAKIHEFIDKALPQKEKSQKIELETIQNLLNEFVNPKDQSTKDILSFVPTILKEFITPLVINIASWTDINGDVLTNAYRNLSTLITSEFKDKMESYEAQLIGYDALIEADKDHCLEQAFGEVLDKVLISTGIEAENVTNPIRKQLLKQAYNLYQMLKSPYDVQQSYRLKLHELMGVDKLKDDLTKYKESADVAALDDMMGFAGEKISEAIKDYIHDEANNFPQLINGFLPQKKLNEADQQWLSLAIRNIATTEDPDLKDLWGYTSDVLHSALMKLFVDAASQLPEASDPKVSKKILIPLLLKKVMGTLGTNRAEIKAKIAEINENVKDTNERKLEMRKLFTPMSEELLKLAGPNSLAVLPIPDALKKTLSTKLKAEILPDLLGKMYGGIHHFEMSSDQDRDKLLNLFKSENPALAAKVLSRLATDILPAAITDPKKDVSAKIFAKFSDFMKKNKMSNERAKAVYEYMDTNSQDLTDLIRDNFSFLFDEKAGINEIAFPAMEDFMEAAVLKVMSHVFTKINEKQNPNRFVDVGLKAINMTNTYLKELSRIMKKQKKTLLSDLDTNNLFNEFRGIHPALSKNYPKLVKTQKDILLHNQFLLPLTEELLKFVGINNENDLPGPEMSPERRKKLYELLKTDLGPSLLQTMISSINLDKIMLSVLKQVNEGLENPAKEIKFPPELENDETQQQFNKACGDLLLNLTKMIPNTMVGTFLASKKIRNIPAETLGKMVRAQLMNLNLLEAINKNMASSLMSLDAQITVDEKGELIIPEDFHFEASDLLKEDTDEDKVRLRKQFVKELTTTIRQVMVFRIKDFFAANWKELQDKIDASIRETFGENALEIKLAVDKIFRLIFINFCGTALQITSYPFLKLIGFFANLHFSRKSQQISDTIHMSIHKDLVFKLAEMAFKTLNEPA